MTANLMSAQADVPPVPAWLTGKNDLLPPITLTEFHTMELTWPKLQSSDVVGNESPEYWAALQTVVEQGEKASLALVWLYAQDAATSKNSGPFRKSDMLDRIFSRDTTSGQWILPLLRYRLEWIEGMHASGDNEYIEMLGDELAAIQGYMNTRGEDADYKKVMSLIAKLAASNATIRGRLSTLLEPQYDAQARANDEWRRRTRPQLYAYHEMAKLTLTARGGDLNKAAKLLAGQIDSLLWAFPQARAVSSKPTASMQGASNHATPAIAKKTIAAQSEEPVSSTPWSIIIFMIVAATGLLWLLLKGHK